VAKPLPSEPEIRRLQPADVPGAVASASRAFHDDPLFNFFEPDLAKQVRKLPAIMHATVADTLPLGETYVAERARAVAAWMPPGTYPRTPRREAMFYVRAAPSMARIGRRLPTAIRLLTALDQRHPKFEHWYLSLLAVDPALQGRGVGGALLQPVLERCDADGLPAYLETQKESNVAWYRRSGFELADIVELPGVPGAPTMWTMVRQPR
jgi:ribosomal protein S18 acetylase RimI-like enzyme